MNDQHFLQLALQQAQQRRGFCAPNPAVGAVVVKNNQVLATGMHMAAGQPHAEVVALEQAGKQAAGATLYVTLEPCCHHGRTPPCTDFIIQSAIAEVVYAFADPNPIVSGQGEAQLKKAGVQVKQVSLPEIDDFYRSYQHWQNKRTPSVTAKLALSLDGKIAGTNGEPIWITGPELQAFTHQNRLASDAILTTAVTVNNDNPQFNVRINNQVIAKPLYILDRLLTLNTDAKVFETAKSVTVFHQQDIPSEKLNVLQAKGARCVQVSADKQGLSLSDVLSVIGQDGIHDLWTEVGGRCFQALMDGKMMNKALLYISPRTLGPKALSAFSTQRDCTTLASSVRWQVVGQDVMCELLFSE